MSWQYFWSGAWPMFLIVLAAVILGIIGGAIDKIPRMIEDARAKAAGFDKVDRMNGRQFETWLAEQFRKIGYKVGITPYIADRGADLILTTKNTRIAVQAKKLTSRRSKVAPRAIGEALRGRENYDCNAAWVVTNQGYTKQAREEGKKCNVRLLGRHDLIRLASGNHKNADLL